VSALDSPNVPVFVSPLAGVHVLAVDDHPDALEVLTVMLTLNGATVTPAASAAEARAAYTARRPDVIVSDVMMPGEDGIALLRSIRAMEWDQRSREVPAVALTGFAMTYGEDLLLHGFNRWLAKPADQHTLVTMVSRLIQNAGM
jgi:CheY-like chemotaxis protein